VGSRFFRIVNEIQWNFGNSKILMSFLAVQHNNINHSNKNVSIAKI
jgi:hypothetical protein